MVLWKENTKVYGQGLVVLQAAKIVKIDRAAVINECFLSENGLSQVHTITFGFISGSWLKSIPNFV